MTSVPNQKKTKKKRATILIPLVKTFGAKFLFASILELIEVLLTFASPQLLGVIVKFVESREKAKAPQSTDENHQDLVYSPLWHGIFFAVLLFIVACLKTLCSVRYHKGMNLLSLRIRTALVSIIYQKSLRLSNTARKSRTVGEIVNLMAVDTARLKDLAMYINMAWTSPLQILLAIYFLWNLLGVAVLAGNQFAVAISYKKIFQQI